MRKILSTFLSLVLIFTISTQTLAHEVSNENMKAVPANEEQLNSIVDIIKKSDDYKNIKDTYKFNIEDKKLTFTASVSIDNPDYASIGFVTKSDKKNRTGEFLQFTVNLATKTLLLWDHADITGSDESISISMDSKNRLISYNINKNGKITSEKNNMIT